MPPKRKLENITRASDVAKKMRICEDPNGQSPHPLEQTNETASGSASTTDVAATNEPSTPPPTNSDTGIAPTASPVSSATATASGQSANQRSDSGAPGQESEEDRNEQTSTAAADVPSANTTDTRTTNAIPDMPAPSTHAVPPPAHMLQDLTMADVRHLLQAQYLFTPGLAEYASAIVSILDSALKSGVRRRAHEILTWSDPDTHTYSIHRLPLNLVWEKTLNNRVIPANVMHLQGSASPCIAWILGRVVSTWFFDGEGTPNKIPAITIAPIHPQTLVVARDVLHSVPAQQQSVRASKFSTSRVRGERASKPIALQEVYDATNANLGYPIGGLCKTIDPSEIAENDLVLLETTLSRYKEGNGNMRHTFNIHSISLLVRSDM